MFVRSLLCASVAVAVMGAPAAATAQTVTPAPAQPPQADPNERICETVTMIGSRLNKKRICASRAEWQEMRLRDRQEVERAQLSPCVIQNNTSTGRPSC